MIRITISRILAFRLSSEMSLDSFVIKKLEAPEHKLQIKEVQKKIEAALLRTEDEIVLEITENEAIEFKMYIDYKIQSLLRVSEQVTEIKYFDNDKLKGIAIFEAEELKKIYDKLCKLTENIN